MTLSLPIVIGKKYVRRDGEVITARASPDQCHEWGAIVDDGAFNTHNTVYKETGRVFGPTEDDRYDLVSDYIEPAKGHPHAALMMEFAKDAQTNADPLSLWEWRGEDGVWYDWEDDGRIKSCAWAADREYRRKPTVTPDPHAENAAEYAKDMALSDKAWKGWECRDARTLGPWAELSLHPSWCHATDYRRKGDSL